MTIGIKSAKQVWAKPEVRVIESTEEMLTRLALANGIPLEGIRAIRRRRPMSPPTKAA